MLNEKVTISICDKSYRLRTDNAKQLIGMSAEVEKRIVDYCAANDSMEKDDAAIFTALDLATEVHALRGECSGLEQNNVSLKKQLDGAALAIEENKALKAASEELKRESTELSQLKKQYESLEKSNAQLSEKLEKAKAEGVDKSGEKDKEIARLSDENAALKKDAAAAESYLEENISLTERLKKAEESAEQLKTAEKRIKSLEKENDKLTAEAEKRAAGEKALNKRIEELDGRLKQYEDACGEAASRADSLEKENKELAERAQQLEKDGEDLKRQLRSSADKVAQLSEKADRYEELMVKYSQTESENAALKACSESAAADSDRLAQLEKQCEELKKQAETAEKEVKELKRTNASLNKQLNEMLEDGQLTL